MKKLLYSIVVFSVLLIVGCQENSIVDPLQVGNTEKTSDSPITGTIQLQGILDNPYPVFNSYFMIDGEITYQLTITNLDPIPPNPQEIIAMQLTVDAGITSYCTVCMPPVNEINAGVISAETNDVLNIIDDNRYTITKTFLIQKRDDGMLLRCSLFVTDTGVTVEAMWLELKDQNLTTVVSE